MKEYNQILIIFAIPIILSAFFGGMMIVRSRYGYKNAYITEANIVSIRNGNHAPTDSFINYALCCYFHDREDVAEQVISEVLPYDSTYWPLQFAIAFMQMCENDANHRNDAFIEPLERAIALNRNNEEFVCYSGDRFNMSCAYLYLSYGYHLRYLRTGDETCECYAEELAYTVIEIQEENYDVQRAKEILKWINSSNYGNKEIGTILSPMGELQ